MQQNLTILQCIKWVKYYSSETFYAMDKTSTEHLILDATQWPIELNAYITLKCIKINKVLQFRKIEPGGCCSTSLLHCTRTGVWKVLVARASRFTWSRIWSALPVISPLGYKPPPPRNPLRRCTYKPSNNKRKFIVILFPCRWDA